MPITAEHILEEQRRTRDSEEFGPHIDSIKKEYPAIGRHSFHVRRGDGPGYVEFYPPWEEYNPAPGVPTIEVRDKGLKDEWLKSAIAGDALHHLGAINPETGEPVDPDFRKFKDDFIQTLTPGQLSVDVRAYNEAVNGGEEKRSFGDWMEGSRVDAYLRGYLFPDQNNEWITQGVYNDQQAALLEQARHYLKTGGR